MIVLQVIQTSQNHELCGMVHDRLNEVDDVGPSCLDLTLCLYIKFHGLVSEKSLLPLRCSLQLAVFGNRRGNVERRAEGGLLVREKFSSLRTSAASVSFECILASPEFRRKLEFVQQISGELPFKTADNVLANVGQEFECTGISRVSSLIFTLWNMQLLTAHYHQWR